MTNDIGLMIDGYQLKQCIYDNKYGNKVYEAVYENNDTSKSGRKKKVAIKVHKKQHHTPPTLHEGIVLAEVDHPNLIQMHSYGHLEDGRLYIVLEWFESETLDSYLEKQPRLSAMRIMQILNEISHGIQSLHEGGYWHGDLHGGNILMYLKKETESPKIILIDVLLKHDARYGDIAAHVKAVREDILGLAAVARMMFFGAYEELNLDKHVRVREFLSKVLCAHEQPMHDLPCTVRNFMRQLQEASGITTDSWYNHHLDSQTMQEIRQTGETPALRLDIPEPAQPRPHIAPATRFKSRRTAGYGVAVTLILLMAMVMALVMAFRQPPCQEDIGNLTHLTVVNGKVVLYDPATGCTSASGLQYSANTWGVSPDNRYLATDFVVIERSSGAVVQNLERTSASAQAVAFSADGRLFARHDGNALSIWLLPSFTLLYQLPDVPVAQTGQAVSPDGFTQFITTKQHQHSLSIPTYTP
jgi:tRNA A-37 threonylcarbamoyl transferase component Bud32